ncbi:hypothetical protein Neosp_013027 [[Neocosmospora] mangrovei]
MASDSGKNLGIDPEVDILDTGDEPSAEFAYDRWPHFTAQRINCEVGMQFCASGGTIYQTYEFRFDGTNIQPPKMITVANQLIRQLDFIEEGNWFNETGIWSPDYETRLSKDKTRIRRSHHIDEGEVVFFIVAYCKGELLTFQHVEEEQVEEEDEEDALTEESQEEKTEYNGRNGTFGILWSDKALEDLRTEQKLKVTFAYRLELFAERGKWDEHISPVNAETIQTAVQRVDNDPFEEHHFTDDCAISPVLRRNLEHILSVCSIPVIAEGDESGEPAIALTCGDMDGHRVATAASFSWMTERILKTCNGHLKWLFGKEYRNLSEDPFTPHCWVNGKAIDGWDNNPYLPSKSLVEVPFQIIKAGDFYARHKEWEVTKETGAVVEAWIKELDQRNKLGRYAFPRYSNEPTHDFYFTDHVFIWRAIKSAESLGFKSKLSISIPRAGDKTYAQRSKKGRNYSSIQVQNEILERFTTENPISKKRMIAVSRSPAHNRFLLRSKDSGLFQAMDLGLFDKPSAERHRGVSWNKIDVWKNLVDSQVYHEDNDDTTWDEPLRFALAFVMSQTGMPMNRRPVEQMRSHALSVLIQSTSASGLFPGRLDANKEPIIYDDEIMRDTYWAISFEIPYLLWRYSPPVSMSDGGPWTEERDEVKVDDTTPDSGFDVEVRNLVKELTKWQLGGKGPTTSTIYPMSHSFSLNNGIGRSNIVELSDEWLYNEPDFFDHVSTSRDSLNNPSTYGELTTSSFDISPYCLQRIAVLDVPRRYDTAKRSLSVDHLIRVFDTTSEFKDFMQQRRSPSKAKKRFCALFSSNRKANKAWHQTPSEQPAIEAFTERHIAYGKFFSEETAAELNKWTTELHLSCYSFGRKKASSSPLMGFLRLNKGRSSRRLTRVTMGFRFDGDFFDRYWTCHFLECNPQMANSFDINEEVRALLLPRGPGMRYEMEESWRQRRVLELLLFDRIMYRMQQCTDDILTEVRLNAWKKPVGSDIMAQGSNSYDYDDDHEFRAPSGRGQEYQRMLQTVEQDLRQNVATIELWLNREKERRERPRWSFNDESRYRDVISKLLISNQSRVQELNRSRVDIFELNELIRNELEQRQADDIKRFTYVTVVFLPLGFATGVFSMSEAPASQTLMSMIITAAVALGTTALFLRGTEPLERLYNRGSRVVDSLVAPTRRRRFEQDVEIGEYS